MKISHLILLRIRNIWDKCFRENQNTLICPITFFFSESDGGYEIMWKNIADPDRSQMTI